MENILNLLVLEKHFHTDDFEIYRGNKTIRLKNNTLKTFLLEPSRDVTISTDAGIDDRKKLEVLGKLGVMKIDFTPRSSSRIKLFDLPADAPTPTSRMVVQTFSGGLVWIERGSRAVYGSGLQANQRVLLSMTGFFN